MSGLLKSVCDLRKLFGDYEKNVEGFNEKLNDLENLLIKVGNYQNSQKVVFIGRGGGRKSELVSELINFTMPDINLKNNKFIEYNFCELPDMSVSESFENSCLKICLPKSQNSILDEITILDTPYYNYSDDLDSEIVEKCKDANIFVLVLNAVGSIGDLDKKFLKRISEKTFVNRLIFIFNNMENVPEMSTKRQHETNSYRIANEILRVNQKIISTFFVRNNKLDTEKFLPLLKNFNLTSDDKKYIWKNLREILEKLQKVIEDEQKIIFKDKKLVHKNNESIPNEKVQSFNNSEKLKLKKEWGKITTSSKVKVNKKNDFLIFEKSTFESEKTVEKCNERDNKSKNKKRTKKVIEKKLKEIKNFTNKSEWKCKIPQDITSIINEFLKLFEDLIHFSKKFDGDEFRPLPIKYNELVDFANGITDGKLFYLIRDILIDIDLLLILILIHFKKHKLKIKIEHKIQTYRKRKEILRDILSKISSADIKNEKRSVTSSNEQKHVYKKPISNQNNFVSNSDEILEKMLAIIKSLIHSDHNEIFVKEAK